MSGLIAYQHVILWGIIGLYFMGWLPLMLGVIFGRERWPQWGIRICIAGLLVHMVWVVIRWRQVGHGPYLNMYEVASSDTIIAMVIYLVAQWKYPRLKVLGIFVLPALFLLMGAGVLSTREPVSSMPILNSSWLVVHVLTAKLAFGAYLISAVLAVAYLLKDKRRQGRILDRFPSNPVNEELNRKFVTLGFLNHTVMLVSGSIWANVAFGSYWSWDAIETWALISWIIYGIFYHMITVHGWKGNRMAWISLVALASIIFAFFGVPLVFKSSHNLFLG